MSETNEHMIAEQEGQIFYSPSGNPEMWATKPSGYFTPAEWEAAHPAPEPEPAPPPTPEEKQAAALYQASNVLVARQQSAMVQSEAFTAQEFTLFAEAGLFEAWAAGTQYVKGKRFVCDGVVYETVQAVTSQAHQAPGSTGMLAVYRPISVSGADEADGSLTKPFAFIYGMDVYKDKYYTFKGKKYLAKSNMTPCVWNPGTPGLWQWELVG